MSGGTSNAVLSYADSSSTPASLADARREIDSRIAAGDPAAACRLLGELWAREPTASGASFVVSRYEQLRPAQVLLPYRLSILRSFTVEPIVPLLRAAAFNAGIDLSVQIGDFNAHVQQILDARSPLYDSAPDAVILAVQTRDVVPDLWRDFADLNQEQIHAAAARVVADVSGWIHAFRSHSTAHLVVHNLEVPARPSRGVLDHQAAISQADGVQQINRELKALAAQHTGVYVLDYDGLVARHGRDNWHDERKWLTVRLPLASQNLNHLANEWLRFLHPLAGKIAKAIVVDLDNTLWGGVVGEDGVDRIKLGAEYPGAAFQAVQRALLDLHHRGILLAVCSKNNRDDAMEALESHPGMLLKPAHFASMRINWSDKAQNLREIAKELNIGTDALAFLDDNPIERQQMRTELPEVYVIDLPEDPMQFARAIRQSPVFERVVSSDEDRQRGSMYQAQRGREQFEQKLTSREDFYRSLAQEAEVAPLDRSTLARIAQLTNKTNQFNVTTRRYTEQQIAAMAATPGVGCWSLRVRDRFGDNGLVGVAITRTREESCEIDTFLLSCRVIGRTVETAFLHFLVERARRQGARRIQGWFVPTKKNAPAKDFYPSHGFVVVDRNESGTLWELDLSNRSVPCPEWVSLRIVDGDQQ
jgi:FkbH-like protein